MTETFAGTLERLRDLLHEQVDGYRSLLESTRAGNQALRIQDPNAFEQILGEQVETLRKLKELESERDSLIREVGSGTGDGGFQRLHRDLQELAEKVTRESRVSRLVIERNGALVEARLALHRRAGSVDREARGGLNHVA
jgi:flagellar biosynthesis/type III secretory pathway chaperone